MTKGEAELLRERLEQDHPNGSGYSWLCREQEGDWVVVKIARPQAEDARPADARNTPGTWG